MNDDELKALYQQFAAAAREHIRADWKRQRESGVHHSDVWGTIRRQHRLHLSYMDREVARVLNDLTKQEQGRE